MTLNGVIAFILRYFTEFDSFGADYVTVVEDRPIMSAKYCIQVMFGQNCSSIFASLFITKVFNSSFYSAATVRTMLESCGFRAVRACVRACAITY